MDIVDLTQQLHHLLDQARRLEARCPTNLDGLDVRLGDVVEQLKDLHHEAARRCPDNAESTQ